VISQGHRVKTELVERFRDLLSSIVGVEQRALAFVTLVQEKTVWVRWSCRIYDVLNPGVATVAAFLRRKAISASGGKLIEMCMNVIHVVYC
jgi:hypothetical protein